jgi:predicted lactoylglutathione lyase
MAVPQRTTLVTLGVADVERAAAFYEALGWRRSSASVEGEVAFIATSGPVLSLDGLGDLARDAGLSAERSGFAGVSLAINLESADEVDRAYGEWLAAGGSSPREPYAADWGGYIAYVADPDGHVWELAYTTRTGPSTPQAESCSPSSALSGRA